MSIVHVDDLTPSPDNPRTTVDMAGLQALATSIATHGMITPIVARRNVHFGLVIVAGERRWRAAKLAGLDTVPVRVVTCDDLTAYQLSLVENLLREDLNPIDEALGYRRLQEQGLRQQAIAQLVGKSQPVISNTLRLLDLPEDVQARIRARELSRSHGVALAAHKREPATVRALADRASHSRMTSKALERIGNSDRAPRTPVPGTGPLNIVLSNGRRLGDLRRQDLHDLAADYEHEAHVATQRAALLRALAAKLADNRAVQHVFTDDDIRACIEQAKAQVAA